MGKRSDGDVRRIYVESVVVPELDGAIYPYVVNDQELDKDGVYLFKAIPERLKNFTGIVSHFIRLNKKRMPIKGWRSIISKEQDNLR